MADSDQLTVIVKDSSGSLTEGATVSLSPSGAEATTNQNGEAVVPLGSATRYDVTVKAKGDEQTVPFYVIKGGSRRLEVNINYLKQLTTTTEAGKKSSSSSDSSNAPLVVGLVLAAVLIVIAAYVMLRRRRR